MSISFLTLSMNDFVPSNFHVSCTTCVHTSFFRISWFGLFVLDLSSIQYFQSLAIRTQILLFLFHTDLLISTNVRKHKKEFVVCMCVIFFSAYHKQAIAFRLMILLFFFHSSVCPTNASRENV